MGTASRHFYGVVLLHFFGIRAFLPQKRAYLPVLDSNFSDAFLAIYCGIFLGSVYKSNLAIICVYFFSLNTLFVFVSRAIYAVWAYYSTVKFWQYLLSMHNAQNSVFIFFTFFNFKIAQIIKKATYSTLVLFNSEQLLFYE